MTLGERAARAIDRLFSGDVSPWIYPVLRIGTALLFILRHADWLRPLVALEHHRWIHGLAYGGSPPEAPALVSPLIPGLVLGAVATRGLVVVRTLLSFSLLLGVRARFSALSLALVSYLVLAADRYRYFHHLHLLYVSLALLALAPLDARLSLERGVARAWRAVLGRAAPTAQLPASAPFWPLVIVRALVVSVYVGAGLAKLDPAWWSGETLLNLYDLHVASGLEPVIRLFGYAGIAKLACLTELALPPLLAVRRTRRWAVVLALVFHAFLGATVAVSTFGAQMALLLLSFWVEPRAEAAKIPRSSFS